MNDRLHDIGRTSIEGVAIGSQSLYLNCAIFLAGNRVLGDETFRLVQFSGTESVSEPFEFHLELHANDITPATKPLTFAEVIGRPVTVCVYHAGANLAMPDEAVLDDKFQNAIQGEAEPSLPLFNGIVASFSMDIPGVYRITMRPALWKLGLTNAYCIHARMSLRDVIDELMRKYRLDFSVDGISGTANLATVRVQDWLQAGETDFEFLRRMMSKAHIYYFFTHTGIGHKVVFANRPAYPLAIPGDGRLRYTFTAGDELGLHQSDVISEYRFEQSLTSSGVQAVFVRQEAAWEQDPVATFQTFRAEDYPEGQSGPGDLPFHQYRIYEYGCSPQELQAYTTSTTDSMEASSAQFSGSSFSPYFRVGHQFTLSAGIDPAVRAPLDGASFVLTKVEHQASLDGSYRNQFQSTEAHGLITPFSIQETQLGAVVAKVVQVEGMPPNDWRYYSPANFDPETNTLSDSTATPATLAAQGVYVRFSSDDDSAKPVWVKLAPHMQTAPEIGVTVLVARANDESELPEIQSIVQANGNKVVKPGGWLASTQVASNYSTNYGDSKSIRFGLHSQADLGNAISIVEGAYRSGQYRDCSYSQGGSYSYSTAEGGAPGLLSRSDSFGSTYSTHHGAESWSQTVFGTTYNNSLVTGDTTSISEVDGTATNTNTQNLVVNTTTINEQISTTFMGITVSTDTTINSNTLSTVGLANSISAHGITNSVSMIGMSDQTTIQGVSTTESVTGESTGMSVTGQSTQVNATGVSDSVNVTGAATQVSLTGVNTTTSLTGDSTTISVTGASSAINVVGSATDVSVTGSSTRVGVTGSSANVSVTGTATEVSMTGTTNNISIKGAVNTIDIGGGGLSAQIQGGLVSMQIAGPSVSILDIKIYI